MRTCTKCGSLGPFQADRSSTDGFKAQCKKCMSRAQALRRERIRPRERPTEFRGITDPEELQRRIRIAHQLKGWVCDASGKRDRSVNLHALDALLSQ